MDTPLIAICICRGEHFRQAQNLRGKRTSGIPIANHIAPSLPTELLNSVFESPQTPAVPPIRRYSGPAPPRSWTLQNPLQGQNIHGKSWRAQSLSLIAERVPRFTAHNFADLYNPSSNSVPPLTLLCLRTVFAACSFSEFVEEVLPYIPSHLRRELIRYHAIRAPLSDEHLWALRDGENGWHVDGELLIVGPQSSLSEDFFLQHSHSDPQDASWDAEVEDASRVLQTLILLNTPLFTSTLPSLPQSITHLALIHVPHAVPVHRLTTVLPLIQVIDLSYNDWLAKSEESSALILGRVEWRRWRGLKLLGLRGCCIPDDLGSRVNMGRWDDAAIVSE